MSAAVTTLADFIAQHGVKLTSEQTDHNPHMSTEVPMDHWKVRLAVGRRSMTLTYSNGVGHKGEPPTADEVLDCLASDASGLDNAQSFEDWCSEYGYDTDSRSAERTYRAILKQAASLKRLLGEDAYETILWKTERQS